MAFKTIHTCDALLGGVSFRATSDGARVNLQTRKAGSIAWKTEAVMTKAAFDAEVEQRGMDSPYGGASPSHMNSILRELQESA